MDDYKNEEDLKEKDEDFKKRDDLKMKKKSIKKDNSGVPKVRIVSKIKTT